MRGLRQPAVLAWLRLARVQQKVARAEAEHLSAHGLSPAQFDVLAHIGAREGLCQQELAQSLLVTKGNVTQLLDRMEEAGLLRRRPMGRSNTLYLTDRGREIFDSVVPAHEALIAEQLSALTPEEQFQLLGLMRRMDRALG